jgi:hypothetical protein
MGIGSCVGVSRGRACTPSTAAGRSTPSAGELVSDSSPAIEEPLDDVVVKALKRRATPPLGAEGARDVCGGFIRRGGRMGGCTPNSHCN